MKFTKTEIPSMYVIELEPHCDERGFFSRSFDEEEFKQRGLNCNFVQQNISMNKHRLTLRGMHFQRMPHSDDKLVRCTKGRLFDVAVDLRRDSPAYLKWVGFELSEQNNRQLYIPRGCAHGFLTLEDNSVIYYQVTNKYNAFSGGASDGTMKNLT